MKLILKLTVAVFTAALLSACGNGSDDDATPVPTSTTTPDATDANATDANATDANATDANATDANVTTNIGDLNITDILPNF